MARSKQLPLQIDGPAQAELAEVRAQVRAIVEARGSRKAGWETLRTAALTQVSLNTYYSSLRARGLEAVLEELVTPARLDAARALVANPPPAPLRRVAVSTMANQFYCELQVHLDTVHDVRVLSAEMAAGAAGHARFEAEAEPISEEEIARRMAAGEGMGLVELPLSAPVQGVELVGRADRVQLQGTRAHLVLEFKFSGRRDLSPSYVAQVQAYGTLLRERGFDTGALVHAVAVLPRGVGMAPGFADQLAAAALQIAQAAPFAPRGPEPAPGPPSDPLAGLNARHVTTDAVALWVFPHEPEAATRTLGWALSYWRGERAPTPTTVPGKCRACAHNAAGLCDAALAPPDGRYTAQQVDGRKGKLHVLTPRPR